MLENGINVLSTYNTEILPYGWFMAAIASSALALYFLIILIGEIYAQFKYTKIIREYKAMIILFIGLIFSIFTIIICGIFTVKKTYNITNYKVTFSDEISFNEVVEKYDIIDQEGLIYTITEKEE